MTARGWTIDDAVRLQTLNEFGLMDSPPEASFDVVTKAAADLCGAPIALVNFLADDRQWFKSVYGAELSEGPIEQSLCLHVLAAGGEVVIDDLSADPRTSTLPAVAGEPGLRFYAGIPLVIEGQGLGTLCVMDASPRAGGLTADQSRGLAELGANLETLIRMRRENRPN